MTAAAKLTIRYHRGVRAWMAEFGDSDLPMNGWCRHALDCLLYGKPQPLPVWEYPPR